MQVGASYILYHKVVVLRAFSNAVGVEEGEKGRTGVCYVSLSQPQGSRSTTMEADSIICQLRHLYLLFDTQTLHIIVFNISTHTGVTASTFP